MVATIVAIGAGVALTVGEDVGRGRVRAHGRGGGGRRRWGAVRATATALAASAVAPGGLEHWCCVSGQEL